MLGTLEHDQKSDCRSHIAPIVQAKNATKNDTTGYPQNFFKMLKKGTQG